ncbi:hypothetical protein CFSAN001627_10553, partial [Clostridium botulinum CFSAN001627]
SRALDNQVYMVGVAPARDEIVIMYLMAIH